MESKHTGIFGGQLTEEGDPSGPMEGGEGIVVQKELTATAERKTPRVKRNPQKLRPKAWYLITFILSRQLSRKLLPRCVVI